MTFFRPCIDLHQGRVKQIVGGSLRNNGGEPLTNFISDLPAEHYADMYQKDGLEGGHLIKLGPGNDDAAKRALIAYPNGLQVGGGISVANAASWLDLGASHVIVTSWLFSEIGAFLPDRLGSLVAEIGSEHLVIDLSCRANSAGGWVVAMNRWQKATDLILTPSVLRSFEGQCAEFLIHAADVEGKCDGIDESLVSFLGQHSPVPVTYAGGARLFEDLRLVEKLSHGRVDLTIGSALDIFGGSMVSYSECVAWNKSKNVS